MSRFDITKSADFAKLTMSNAAGVLTQLTGLEQSQWQISEGSYDGVLFHVFKSKVDYQGAVDQVVDQGGRRKVKYRFPYRDGQTTDDLGRKAETFEVNILLHGPRYMKGYKALKAKLDKPTPGELVHPVMGKITVVPEDWTITHSSEKRRAMAIRVTFIEHNFTAGDLTAIKDGSVKGALARALDAFAFVDRVISEVTGKVQLARNLRTTIKTMLDGYKAGYATNLVRMNKAFNQGSSADIPGLLPVNEGGTRNDDGTSAGDTFPTVGSDAYDSVPSGVSDTTAAALATIDAINATNALRKMLAEIIELLSSALGGKGGIDFHDAIVMLKQTAAMMQDVLDRGMASSQSRIINYKLPRHMSIREVAFINGLPVDRCAEILILNPQMLSTNHIVKGTELKVPVS